MSPQLPHPSDYWACRRIAPPGNRTSVRRHFSRQPNAAILESVTEGSVSGRWSWFAHAPVATVRARSRDSVDAERLFATLRSEVRPRQARGPLDIDLPPFAGGWIGYFAYEAGVWIEPTAGCRHAPTPFGLAEWRFHDSVLAHDNHSDLWYVCAVKRKHEPDDATILTDRMDCLTAFANECSEFQNGELPPQTCDPAGHWNLADDEYLQRVERILTYILAGDTYQVNLTRRFVASLETGAEKLYDALCRNNPAAYAAFLRFDDGDETRSILSSSPELFLALDDGIVTTRPIKGTRPKIGDETLDAIARAELVASEKERAELNMIIDLERNDLGRVCEYGSVHVESDGEIEVHPTVFHRTATIRGRLREAHDAIDLIRATFPGGSITGAPKVRAMQVIDELEREARGPYCGAIGYIGVNGDMQLNLPIRTLTTFGDRVELAVGSGIVADSDPRQELEELHAKARGMMRAIATCQRETGAPGAFPLAGVISESQ